MTALDANLQIANLFAPTAIGANISVAAVIDRLAIMDDGIGNLFDFYVQLAQAVTSAGAATVDFQLLGNATDPTFASGNVVLADTGPIGKAALIAGHQFSIPISRQAWNSLQNVAGGTRYLTINAIIGTAALTAGQFNAWILPHNGANQSNLAYPNNYTV